MTNDLKDKILQALEEEPNLTTDQLLKLVGGKLNTLQKALKSLEVRGVVKAKRFGERTPYFWRLKSSKELTELTYKHEKQCADIYIALKLTGLDFLWIHKDDQKQGFRFDRSLQIFDKQFYFEVETGSAYSRRKIKIPEKIQNYMKLQGRFHVIFTVADYEVTAKQYGEEILDIIEPYHRGSQFLVAPIKGLAHNILGDWLIHPSGDVYSLETVS